MGSLGWGSTFFSTGYKSATKSSDSSARGLTVALTLGNTFFDRGGRRRMEKPKRKTVFLAQNLSFTIEML